MSSTQLEIPPNSIVLTTATTANKRPPISSMADVNNLSKDNDDGAKTTEKMRKEFAVKYAGLIADVDPAADPSGRTDLLKQLDAAEWRKEISVIHNQREFVADALVTIDCEAFGVTDLDDKALHHLVAPLHLIASIGYVRDRGDVNIVAVRIGLTEDTYDLAVLYTETATIAEEMCSFAGACFQRVYRDAAVSAMAEARPINGKIRERSTHERKQTVLHDDSTTASTHENAIGGVELRHLDSITSITSDTEADIDEGDSPLLLPKPLQIGGFARGGMGSSSTDSSSSSRDTLERINDYISTLSTHLSHEELAKFALLMRRWRAKELPTLEFAQKLLELYGTERKHLLARMESLLRGVTHEEITALSHFLRANGVETKM